MSSSFSNKSVTSDPIASHMSISNYSDVITALRKGNSFVQYDLEKEVIQGIVEYNGVVMDVAFLNTIERIVVADCMGKTMVVNSLEEMPLTHCDCIDLDSKGRRWEGSVIDNKPYGYGAIYNEEENREYEGFMLKDVKTCCGTEYYGDLGTIRYRGWYLNDQKHGYGTLYDRTGAVVVDGLWKNDHPYTPQFDGRTIDSFTESLHISEYSFPELPTFVLKDWFGSLRTISIGDNSFSSVRSFELCNLNSLESLTIGKACFRISSEAREDGCLEIRNCPSLCSIQIGDWSFDDYKECAFEELSSLQSLQLGEYCFTLVRECSLHGVFSSLFSSLDLPELEIISLNRYVFANAYSIAFES